MDTIFQIIKENSILTLGADHFGTDSNLIRATRIILDILNHKDVITEDYLFAKHHIYYIENGEYQDIEVTIDTRTKKIILSDNIHLIEVEDDPSYVHVEFDRFDLLTTKTLTYEEFDLFQSFFLIIKEYDEVLINNKYLYKIY